MRPLVVLLLVAATATAAQTAPPAGAAAKPDEGRPLVEVRAGPDGDGGLIQGAIDVAAPPEVVFQVITDCDLAPKMVATLKSCRILMRDPEGRWDVREQVSKMTFLPSIRNVIRSEYDPPGRVRFHRVGGDLRVYEGEWRIDPLADGSRVTYESRVSIPFHVPHALARMSLRMQVSQALLALRRECLLRAAS